MLDKWRGMIGRAQSHTGKHGLLLPLSFVESFYAARSLDVRMGRILQETDVLYMVLARNSSSMQYSPAEPSAVNFRIHYLCFSNLVVDIAPPTGGGGNRDIKFVPKFFKLKA